MLVFQQWSIGGFAFQLEEKLFPLCWPFEVQQKLCRNNFVLVHKELPGKFIAAISSSCRILSTGTLINIKEERELGIFLIKSGAAWQMRSVPRWG